MKSTAYFKLSSFKSQPESVQKLTSDGILTSAYFCNPWLIVAISASEVKNIIHAYA